MFDLESDPDERFDVRRKHAEVFQELTEQLRDWEARHPEEGLRLERNPPADWVAPTSTIYELMEDRERLP